MRMVLGAVGLLMLAGVVRAETTVYYRVVSTQQTVIVSTDPDGTITWTNSIPDSTCSVQQTFWLDGYWTRAFDSTNLLATGLVRRTRVPVPSHASNDAVCAHNLHLIWTAMQAHKEMYARECWDTVTFGDLISAGLLPDPPPQCPSEGIYAISVYCADPTCSIGGGHSLSAP